MGDARDDRLQREVLEYYRFNLQRMVEIAGEAGVPLVFVVPASNEADCSPFRSVVDPGLSADTRQRIALALEHAGSLAEAGELAAAEAGLREVIALDPRQAAAHYALGRVLRRQGRIDPAQQAFARARDEDVCPLRALTAIQQGVRRVGRETGTPVVDFDAALRALARERDDGLLGDALFLDHVHPTIEGNRLLASLLLEQLEGLGLARPRADWRQTALAEAIREVEAGIDLAAHGRSLRNVAKVLSWAGKLDEAAVSARRADELLGGDAESRFILGSAELEHGRYAQAARHFRASLALDSGYAKAHNNLALALAQLGEHEASLAHYDAALRIDPEHATAHYNRANLLAREGRLDEAIAGFRRALAIDPEDEDARFNLAQALHRSGENLRAASELRALVERGGGDAEVSRTLEEVERAAALRR